MYYFLTRDQGQKMAWIDTIWTSFRGHKVGNKDETFLRNPFQPLHQAFA